MATDQARQRHDCLKFFRKQFIIVELFYPGQLSHCNLVRSLASLFVIQGNENVFILNIFRILEGTFFVNDFFSYFSKMIF